MPPPCTSCGQCFLVQSVVGKDLLGVLAHGHIAVAHAEQNVPGLEVLGQRIEAVDALIAILGHAQNDLVLQQVHAGIAVHEVQSFGVHIGGSGAVQLVHLLLTGGDEANREMCGQVIYPAAVLKAAPNAEAAREFLAYLQTDRAATVFESDAQAVPKGIPVHK